MALETSRRPASIAARFGGRSASLRLAEERAHASDLLPTLDELLAELDARAADIELVIVATGPGSYTGLRVGVATALGLARGTGAALCGVPSLEALAHGELHPGEEAVVLLDARAQALYFAHYARTDQGVEELHAPAVLSASEVRARLPEGVRILADATAANAAELPHEARGHLTTDALPSASSVLELGLARFERCGPVSPSELRPLYLRPFQVRLRTQRAPST